MIFLMVLRFFAVEIILLVNKILQFVNNCSIINYDKQLYTKGDQRGAVNMTLLMGRIIQKLRKEQNLTQGLIYLNNLRKFIHCWKTSDFQHY